MRTAIRLGVSVLMLLLPACTQEAASRPRTPPQQEKQEEKMLAQRGKVILQTRAGKELQLDVEIASNDADRTRGLMFRKSMPEMAGMIFVFPEEEFHSFWMKNTYLPLDMMFADKDGLILGIVENAQPHSLDPRYVEGESKYVLEVNGGFSARHGVSAGDRLTLVGMYDLR